MLGLLIAAAALPAAGLAAEVERAPPEVRAFILRRAGCNHWAGEDAYDPERGREIERALRDLRCERIEADERVLRRARAGRPDLLKLLDATADADGAI